jgi:hypothetical protein
MNKRKLKVIKPAAWHQLLLVGFYDPDRPNPNIPDQRMLTGVAVIRTDDFNLLMSKPHRFVAKHGSEVEWVEINHHDCIPERFIGRLISEAEYAELKQFWPPHKSKTIKRCPVSED